MKAKVLSVQEVFIQKLKESMPPSIGLAEEMSELLGVSIDSAYRRIRGETDLSISEVHKITKKYGISLDGVFSNLGDTVSFTYTKLTDSSDNFEKYLKRLYGHLNMLKSFPEKKIIYVAEELPIFYSFFSKKLAEFKLFYWQRSVLNVPIHQSKKFEFGCIDPSLVELAHNCYTEYLQIPSDEIWTDKTILTVTKQIEFYVESGVFKNKKDAIELIESIKDMSKMIEEFAENKRKLKSDKDETYQLYSSEVVLGTNCIYVIGGDFKHAYITFNTMNSLTTNNAEFCDETDHWIKNIIKKSTLISGVAEKQRYQFFNKMNKHIEDSIEKINSY